MVCGHGYIWAVALYITEDLHCRISGRDKNTIPAGKEMCDRPGVSLSINTFLTQLYKSQHSQSPQKYSKSYVAPFPRTSGTRLFPESLLIMRFSPLKM